LNVDRDESEKNSDQGHFVVAAIRGEDDSVTYYDAESERRLLWLSNGQGVVKPFLQYKS